MAGNTKAWDKLPSVEIETKLALDLVQLGVHVRVFIKTVYDMGKVERQSPSSMESWIEASKQAAQSTRWRKIGGARRLPGMTVPPLPINGGLRVESPVYRAKPPEMREVKEEAYKLAVPLAELVSPVLIAWAFKTFRPEELMSMYRLQSGASWANFVIDLKRESESQDERAHLRVA